MRQCHAIRASTNDVCKDEAYELSQVTIDEFKAAYARKFMLLNWLAMHDERSGLDEFRRAPRIPIGVGEALIAHAGTRISIRRADYLSDAARDRPSEKSRTFDARDAASG